MSEYWLTHEELTSELTGEAVPYEAFTKAFSAKEKIKDQTMVFADALEGIGISAYSGTSSTVTVIGAVTMRMDTLPNYRRIMFLPSVAKTERTKHLNALEKFMRDDVRATRKNYFRYAVVTAGKPLVPGKDNLKKAIHKLTKSISRAASEADKLYDIDFIYRGVEFTLKERDRSGVPTLHLHANVVYRPRRKLSEGKWEEFLSFFHRRTGGNHWKDCGRVGDVHEIVKYVIKPEDVSSILASGKPVAPADEVITDNGVVLCNTSDITLHWLYHGLFRARLSTPLGPFKDYVSTLKQARKKVVHGGKRGLIEVLKAERLGGHNVENNNRKKKESTAPCRNVILGITLPSAIFSPWKEPIILVQNMDPNGLNWDILQRQLDEIRHEALEDWNKNGAPDVNIALGIADAVRGGAAHNVVPFVAKKPVEESASYKVHTFSLIAQTSEISNKPDSEERLIRLNKFQEDLSDIINELDSNLEMPIKKRRTA